MSLDEATRQRITDLVEGNEVVLFMKGNPRAPQCGFSARVVAILDEYLPSYQTLDVLQDPEIREGIKHYSSWPTIPQLYVRGEFIGGCDIVTEMAGSGELFGALGVEPPPTVVPTIHISDKAAAGLRQAAGQHAGPGQQLRLTVDRGWKSGLTVGEKGPLDVEVESNGVTLLVDRMSAQRAEGIRIDVVDTPRGPGFKVDNPNAPTVGALNVHQLKALIDSDEPFELLDVRSEREYETARIDRARLLDDTELDRLQGLDRETKIVLICHHGPRGVNMAERLLEVGFTNVHNVEGGMDAWSLEIDSSVPRY